MFERFDPTFGDGVNRNGVEEVELFSAFPMDRDEIGFFQLEQVLGDRLPRHIHAFAELAERLPAANSHAIQQPPPAGIGQGFKQKIGGGFAGRFLVRGIHGLSICNQKVACQGLKSLKL